MQTRMMSICLLALVVSTPFSATAQEAIPAVALKSARLTITGTSTMHPYSLVSTTATVVAAKIAGPALLQPGMLEQFEVQIPVAAFNSDKDGLKKKMLDTMKADKHPTIAFKLNGYTSEGDLVRARGTLTVAGVAREVDLDLTVKETAAGFHITGTRPLLMTEFGIKPPTMFMGMLKTHDQITIALDLQLSHAVKASN